MNDWKSDEALYASALDPNKRAAKEIESLREEVAKLTREITMLQRDLATARQEREAWDKEFGKYLTKRYDSRQRAFEEDSAAFVEGLQKAEEQRKNEINKEHTKLIKLIVDAGG